MPTTRTLTQDTLIHELAAAIGDRFFATTPDAEEDAATHRRVVDAAYGVLAEHFDGGVLGVLGGGGGGGGGGVIQLATPPRPLERGIDAGDVVRLRSGGPLMTVQQMLKATPTAKQMGQREDAAHTVWINHTDGMAAQAHIGTPALERIDMLEHGLVEAAKELWGPRGVLDANDPKWDHPFDYYQSTDGTRRIVRFGKALAAIDGKARSFEPRSKR